MGLQIVSLTTRKTMSRQTTCNRRLGGDPISLDDFNMRCLFKNAAGISIQHRHNALSDEQFCGVRKACCQSSEFLPFKKNVTDGVVLLNKVSNHNQWLTELLQPSKAYFHAPRSLNVKRDSQERCRVHPKTRTGPDPSWPTVWWARHRARPSPQSGGPVTEPVLAHSLMAVDTARNPGAGAFM